MNREKFLIIHNADPKLWAIRYGLEPFEHPCSKCGKKMITSIPIAQGELRGLISPPCLCGNLDTPYCFVRDPKKGDFFNFF